MSYPFVLSIEYNVDLLFLFSRAYGIVHLILAILFQHCRSDSRESTVTNGIKRKALDIPPVKKMTKICSSGKEVETIYNELFSSAKKRENTELNTEKAKVYFIQLILNT